MSATPKRVSGLAGLVAAHDLFLVDQFGVLHDGSAPYSGAAAALERLRTAGKRSVILTNSGRRSAPNTDRLVQLGFPRQDLGQVVSSGEVNWHGIREGRFGSRFKPGARVHVVGRPGDDYGLQGLDLTLVEHPEAAEFILIAGSDAPRIGMDRYQAQLAPAVQAGVPALCANPDKLMLTARGLQPAPGAIAEVYRQLGGIVTYTGKPYPDIYRFALALVAGTDPARVLAIGDSIEHDIAGAARMGLRSALIRKGILADLDDAGLARLYEQHRATPDFILERFVW